MARKKWPWRITVDRSKCEYAFFVSRVSEDSAEVVQFRDAIIKAFKAAGGLALQPCFLDVHDWDVGNPPTAVIRRKLAASQFFIGWVTPDYLEHARRGWPWFELAYAEIIELNRQPLPDVEFPYVVPVFRGVSAADISRTPWQDYLSREIVKSLPHEDTKAYIDRLVPRLVAYYAQEMRKWTGGA